MTPKVTVISAFYNRASLVEESLESILNQTFQDWELIAFDDQSMDDTYEQLKKIQSRDSRVSAVQNEKNLGFTQGMNHNLKKARGQYIAVHGSGDISHPERLEKQACYLDDNPDCKVVSCRVRKVHADGSVSEPDKGVGVVTFSDLYETNRFYHGEVMYRRSDFEALNGYREIFKVAADYDLWLRMTKDAHGYILDEELYTLYSPENALSRDLKNRVKQKIIVGYARQMVDNGIIVDDSFDPESLDLSNDKRLESDFGKIMFAAINARQWDAFSYASKEFKKHFRKSHWPQLVRALTQKIYERIRK